RLQDARRWRDVSPSLPSGTPTQPSPFHGRRTGAAIASSPNRSNSGRVVRRGFTTVSAIVEPTCRHRYGLSSAWRRDPEGKPNEPERLCRESAVERRGKLVTGGHVGTTRSLAALILLGIANHSVLTGSRVIVSLDALSMGASPFTVGVLMSLYALLPML